MARVLNGLSRSLLAAGNRMDWEPVEVPFWKMKPGEKTGAYGKGGSMQHVN